MFPWDLGYLPFGIFDFTDNTLRSCIETAFDDMNV